MRRVSLWAILFILTLGVSGAIVSLLPKGQPTSPAAAQEAVMSQRMITVTGEGSIAVAPDQATVVLGAEILDPDPATAQREVERRIQAVLTVFRQAGIPDSKIKTVTYSLNVERDWSQPNAPIVGYRMIHQVEVAIQPLNRVGELLGQAVAAGANSIGGVTFTLANPQVPLRQARELAVRDAHEKAAQLAQLTNIALGAPLRISESVGMPPVLVPRASAGGEVALPSGELTVTVTVSIDYAIQ